MTLAIRKLECWVNVILPIMFIKEMNKLVTVRTKHDQKANFEIGTPPPPPLFVACCVSAGCIPELHAACVSDTTFISVYMLMTDPAHVRVCEALLVWLLYQQAVNCPPPPSPRCKRRFWHRSAAPNRLRDRARRDQTDSTGTLHKTTV